MAVACLARNHQSRITRALRALAQEHAPAILARHALQGRPLACRGGSVKPLPDLGALVKLAGKRLKGAVIWDPAVPASVNVATTIAGVEDARRAQPGIRRSLSCSSGDCRCSKTCVAGSPARKPAAGRTTPTVGRSGSIWPRAAAPRTCFAFSKIPSRPARGVTSATW